MAFTQVGKSYTSVSGLRATDSVGSSAAMRDVQKAMVTFQPYQTPILTRLLSAKAGKKPTGNIKFEWGYSTLLPRTTTLVIAGGSTNETITNANIGDLTLFQVGSTVVVDSTGEVLTVQAWTSATSAVFYKVGSGNITAVASATVHFLGESFEQGVASATAKSVNKNFEFNYTQIFKKSVHFSRSQLATLEYGEEDKMRNKRDRMQEWKLDMESTLLFGRAKTASTGYQVGSHTQQWTGGLFYGSGTNSYINGNQTGVIGDITETYFFNTLSKNIFAKGTARKRLYAGAGLVSVISKFSRDHIRTQPGEKEYGVRIRSLMTDFGDLEVAWHPMLDGTNFTNFGVVLDLGGDYIKYRYLSANGENRDMQFEEFGYLAEADQYKGQFIGECGWQIEGDDFHYTITPSA